MTFLMTRKIMCIALAAQEGQGIRGMRFLLPRLIRAAMSAILRKLSEPRFLSQGIRKFLRNSLLLQGLLSRISNQKASLRTSGAIDSRSRATLAVLNYWPMDQR